MLAVEESEGRTRQGMDLLVGPPVLAGLELPVGIEVRDVHLTGRPGNPESGGQPGGRHVDKRVGATA